MQALHTKWTVRLEHVTLEWFSQPAINNGILLCLQVMCPKGHGPMKLWRFFSKDMGAAMQEAIAVDCLTLAHHMVAALKQPDCHAMASA